MVPVSALADDVLPLVRTRSDLSRWSAANGHGGQMHEAVDLLEEAAERGEATEAFAVTQKAIASALKVIMRADDSSGVIGDACQRLLDLHARLAPSSGRPVAKLVEWMIAFQFQQECDYFTLDPVAYAPALGAAGMAAYRARLEVIASGLGPRPARSERWNSAHSHEWHVLEWNEKRLAVHDRDVDAIIATHAGDRKVAAWFEETAKALAEIDEIDLAIDWARRAMEFDLGHQSLRASRYWCGLVAEHRPEDLLAARVIVFRRWPTVGHADALMAATLGPCPDLQAEVEDRLEASPPDAVAYALRSQRDVHRAWDLAHRLDLQGEDLWYELAEAYEPVSLSAALAVQARLVATMLSRGTDARAYRQAAHRLARMRKVAAGTSEGPLVDLVIAELRQEYRRRPRLQQEFTQARLP